MRIKSQKLCLRGRTEATTHTQEPPSEGEKRSLSYSVQLNMPSVGHGTLRPTAPSLFSLSLFSPLLPSPFFNFPSGFPPLSTRFPFLSVPPFVSLFFEAASSSASSNERTYSKSQTKIITFLSLIVKKAKSFLISLKKVAIKFNILNFQPMDFSPNLFRSCSTAL